MFQVSLYKRFTYSKTKEFWNIIEEIESIHPIDSFDYSITVRDKIIFHLLYSYGLRPTEVLNLSIFDFNFTDKDALIESFGSIFINSRNARLVYPIFFEVTKDIKKYLDIYNLFFRESSRSIFTTIKGKPLSPSNLNDRLKYYNSKLPLSKKIYSLNIFRQYYIADLLRFNGISQSFINNQIGNNVISNQVYLHLKPNNTSLGDSK